jgi:hypothetical protein
MIKKTVSYKDYNNKPVTQDLYFHLKMDTITDNLGLSDRLEALGVMFEGEQRELKTEEKQEILNVVKLFINLSYGVKSADGSKFQQRQEHLDDFRDSAAYDAFLWALFQDPAGAMSFMNDVMPQDLIEQARQQQGPKVPQDRLPKATASSEPQVSDSQEVDLDVEDDDSIEVLEARLAAAKAAAVSAVRSDQA